MDCATIIVLHYTFGWTQSFLNSVKSHMPNHKIIVFNNNPFPDQKVTVTRCECGEANNANNLCQLELNFVKKHSSVQCVIEVPRSKERRIEKLPSHGDVLEYVFDWLEEQGYTTVMHLEPDCVVSGSKWFEDMTNSMKDNWLVGTGHLRSHGDYVTQMCPTLWSVNDINRLRFEKQLNFNKGSKTNTGQKIMRSCCDEGKVTIVDVASTISHKKGGSKNANSSYILKM